MKAWFFVIVLNLFIFSHLKLNCIQDKYKNLKYKIEINDELNSKLKKDTNTSDCNVVSTGYQKIYEKINKNKYIGIFRIEHYNDSFSSACINLLLQYNDNIILLNFNNYSEDFNKLINFIEKHKIKKINALLLKTLNEILIFNNKYDAANPPK